MFSDVFVRWELQATVESPPTMTVPVVMNSDLFVSSPFFSRLVASRFLEVVEILPKLPVLYHSTVPPSAAGD